MGTLALRPSKPTVVELPAEVEPLATQQYFGQLPEAPGIELATQIYMGEPETSGLSAFSQNVENEEENEEATDVTGVPAVEADVPQCTEDSETLPFGGEPAIAWPGDPSTQRRCMLRADPLCKS